MKHSGNEKVTILIIFNEKNETFTNEKIKFKGWSG